MSRYHQFYRSPKSSWRGYTIKWQCWWQYCLSFLFYDNFFRSHTRPRSEYQPYKKENCCYSKLHFYSQDEHIKSVASKFKQSFYHNNMDCSYPSGFSQMPLLTSWTTKTLFHHKTQSNISNQHMHINRIQYYDARAWVKVFLCYSLFVKLIKFFNLVIIVSFICTKEGEDKNKHLLPKIIN